jgi:hypothetical protein
MLTSHSQFGGIAIPGNAHYSSPLPKQRVPDRFPDFWNIGIGTPLAVGAPFRKLA